MLSNIYTFEEHEKDWLNSELLDAEKNIDVVASQSQELIFA